jgi:hypothetical protein
MIAYVLKIGATLGEVPVDELLPDARTISRNVEAHATILKAEIKTEVEEVRYKWPTFLSSPSQLEAFQIFSKYGGGITTDFWTDDYTKTSYFAVTAHYVTSDWQLKHVLLGIQDWPANERHTAENIRPALYEVSIFISLLVQVCQRLDVSFCRS